MALASNRNFKYGYEVDIYSVGVVAFELVNKRCPGANENGACARRPDFAQLRQWTIRFCTYSPLFSV